MASVAAVSSNDFRTSLTQSQIPAPEGDDPFAEILNAIGNPSERPERPEAPRVPERRADSPAKNSKPQTEPDPQAKRRAPETDAPDVNARSEAAPVAPVENAEEDDNDSETGDADASTEIEALLALATAEAQSQTEGETVTATPSAASETAETAASAIVPALNVAAAGSVAAHAAADPASAVQNAAVQAAQTPAAAKPVLDAAKTPARFDAAAELPQNSSETPGLAKPVRAIAVLDALIQNSVQTPTQPGSVNPNNAAPLHGPSQLEMLNAAIQKHAQLALGNDAPESAPDSQKPLISSNAVAPNFAMTAQVNAPVNVQAQQVTDASRTVPLDQLAVEIATRANKGERRFDIRLDPPELGRIDVRLEIDSKGNTTTKLIVERAETLDMLQRDARGLEKALQNAGLKTDAGGLQFSLQQDTQTQQNSQHNTPEYRGRPDLVQAESEIMTEISVGNASLAAQLRGGVDIRI